MSRFAKAWSNRSPRCWCPQQRVSAVGQIVVDTMDCQVHLCQAPRSLDSILSIKQKGQGYSLMFTLNSSDEQTCAWTTAWIIDLATERGWIICQRSNNRAGCIELTITMVANLRKKELVNAPQHRSFAILHPNLHISKQIMPHRSRSLDGSSDA